VQSYWPVLSDIGFLIQDMDFRYIIRILDIITDNEGTNS